MWTGNGGTDTIPDIHESRPPDWLPKTHASADLGQAVCSHRDLYLT
jgi:hypothetical protein